MYFTLIYSAAYKKLRDIIAKPLFQKCPIKSSLTPASNYMATPIMANDEISTKKLKLNK